MADITDDDAPEGAGKKQKPLLLILILSLIGAGGGFYASWSGLILAPTNTAEVSQDIPIEPMADVVFVPLDPMVISLRQPANASHLRFRADLEVPSAHQAEVEKMLPRVMDVLNTYLRAVKVQDLESPTILTRLRAQMFHRIELVVGPGRISNVLVMEFVFT